MASKSRVTLHFVHPQFSKIETRRPIEISCDSYDLMVQALINMIETLRDHYAELTPVESAQLQKAVNLRDKLPIHDGDYDEPLRHVRIRTSSAGRYYGEVFEGYVVSATNCGTKDQPDWYIELYSAERGAMYFKQSQDDPNAEVVFYNL